AAPGAAAAPTSHPAPPGYSSAAQKPAGRSSRSPTHHSYASCNPAAGGQYARPAAGCTPAAGPVPRTAAAPEATAARSAHTPPSRARTSSPAPAPPPSPAPLGAWLVPTSRDPAAPRLDLAGFVLSVAGVAAVVYTTIEAPARGWLAPVTLAGYGAGVALLAVFALWERRVGEPMLDITLFRNIRFSAASFSIAVAFFGLFGFIFLITLYFQLVHGYSPLSAGVRTLPFALGVGAAAPAAPVFARRLGTKIVVPAGLLLMGAGFLIASTLGSDSAYFGPVLASMVLMAVGLGLATAPSTGAILAVLPLAKAGVGSAVNDVTRELGGTFGVAVVGAVFSSVYGPRLAQLLHGAGVPAPALAAARQSPAAALQVAGQAPASAHAVIIDAANQAFVAGLSRGSLVCAGVVALGGVFAFLVLPRRLPGTPPGPPAEPGSKPGRTSSAKLGRP